MGVGAQVPGAAGCAGQAAPRGWRLQGSEESSKSTSVGLRGSFDC